MKKLLIITSTLLAVTVAASAATTSAAAAVVSSEPTGVYAVADDGELISGAPDADRIEQEQEFELYVNSKEVLSVGASGAADKRYHVDFMLPDTTYEVYLTGLCADDVDQIQQAIIANYTEGEPFDFNDLDFIDAEKLQNSDDSMLCWAASCSNMLVYSGWAQQAGFADEDEVFDLYIDSFNDYGGFQRDGLAWFFNGVALSTNTGLYALKVLDYPNSGNYFRNYAYDMVCNYELIRGVTQLNHMEERLRSGYAVSPGVGLVSNGVKTNGGHAITLWGFVTDTSLEKDDINRFRSVFITDSDSDMNQPSDRTLADNVINMLPVYVNAGNELCFDYDNTLSAAFEDFTYLMPYSKSVPREKDIATMRNKIKYPDLCFGMVSLSDDKYDPDQKTVFESDDRVYLAFNVDNASDKDYREDVNVAYSVTDEKGEKVIGNTVTLIKRRLDMAYTTDNYYTELTGLAPGNYTLTLKVNEKRPLIEAYYYNNTYTLEFKVRDKFVLGDVNEDGVIDVTDATSVQMYSAGLRELTEAQLSAADVNVDGTVDVADATQIQKYAAGLIVDFE